MWEKTHSGQNGVLFSFCAPYIPILFAILFCGDPPSSHESLGHFAFRKLFGGKHQVAPCTSIKFRVSYTSWTFWWQALTPDELAEETTEKLRSQLLLLLLKASSPRQCWTPLISDCVLNFRWTFGWTICTKFRLLLRLDLDIGGAKEMPQSSLIRKGRRKVCRMAKFSVVVGYKRVYLRPYFLHNSWFRVFPLSHQCWCAFSLRILR